MLSVLTAVLSVLCVSHWASAATLNFVTLEACFTDFFSVVNTQLVILNPLMCRDLPEGRKTFSVPTVEESFTNDTTNVPILFTQTCPALKTTALTPSEIQQLTNVKQVLEGQDLTNKYDAAVVCVVQDASNNTLSTRLDEVYKVLLDAMKNSIIDLTATNRGVFEFSSNTFSGSETDGMANITIVRTQGTEGWVEVRLNLPVSGDSAQLVVDYENILNKIITFPNGSVSETFSVTLVDDQLFEGPQTFGITLSPDTPDASAGAVNRTTVTIIDNDLEVNECQLPIPPTCPAGTRCVDTVSYYICQCKPGYVITPSGACEFDITIDRCTPNPCTRGSCALSGVDGTTCTCQPGWTGDYCDADLNECTQGTFSCNANAYCQNTVGSYDCICNSGFLGDGQVCEDINECTGGTHDCHADAYCNNTIGGFNCTCNPGYRGNGTYCEDINECLEGTFSCGVNAHCSNKPGGYDCFCDAGFRGDGQTCTDIDECAEGTDTCDANGYCNNTMGGYNCTCNDGYGGDGFNCSDIDECAEGIFTCDANAGCNNTAGSYFCECNNGFMGDGKSCTDIDECANGLDNCDINGYCNNTIGSYNCTCNDGYRGDGVSCADIDECTEGTFTCDANAGCGNIPGSYVCQCNPGFLGDGKMCLDINECVDGTDQCHINATCTNTPGNYTCACKPGYEGNGFTCSDIDECTAGTFDCIATANCENFPGGYTCVCKPGYRGNGTECTDINECTEGTAGCHAMANCTNSPGSFTCQCIVGYTGNGFTCSDVNECVAGTDSCHADGVCTNSIGSYTCACKPGFLGNGFTCTDINECTDNTDNCHRYANCTNTPGSFNCTCITDYGGDGVMCSQCIYDCAGVCNGNAVTDCNGDCTGGTTGTATKMKDACGVCGGSGTTCTAVTSVTPERVSQTVAETVTVNGAGFSATTQCVVRRVMQTTETAVTVDAVTDASTLSINLTANSLEVGQHNLLCRAQSGSSLGTSTAVLFVYDSTMSSAQSSCIIEGPNVVDSCSDVYLKGTASKGGGLFGLTYTWSFLPDTGGVTISEPVTGHMRGTGFAVDTDYTVTLRVCSVFSVCTQCTHSVRKSSTNVPTVSIKTPVDITAAPANTPFELIGVASASKCSGAVVSDGGLNFTWTLSGAVGLKVNTGSTSNRIYQVRPGDLPAGSVTLVSLEASLASSSAVNATSTISLTTTNRPLEVIIAGGDQRTAGVNSGVQTFDATGTQDPDTPSSVITFSWSSQRYTSTDTLDGSCIGSGASTNAVKLLIDPSSIAVGGRCVITLSASSDTGKSASKSVTLSVTDGSSPVCFIDNPGASVMPGRRLVLKMTCTSSVNIATTVWSSVAGTGVTQLDTSSAIQDQYMDSLTGNEYKMFVAIRSGVLESNRYYEMEATVTDASGGQSKNRVTLNLPKGVIGGKLTCPSAYVDLNMVSVDVMNLDGPSGLTYALFVETSQGQYRPLSVKQSSRKFTFSGPKLYGLTGNMFLAEVCPDGVSGQCRTITCRISSVVGSVSVADLNTEITNRIATLRKEERFLDAAVALGILFDKTSSSTLLPVFLAVATEVVQTRTMNENSASIFLATLASFSPSALSASQFTTFVGHIGTAVDYFTTNNVQLPALYVSSLNQWIIKAQTAGQSGSEIQTLKNKMDLLQATGLSPGSIQEFDLQDGRVTIYNDVPGDALLVKDANGNDVLIKFGKSVREKVNYANVKIRITSYKQKPATVTDTTSSLAGPVVDISLSDSTTNAGKSITGLVTPATISLKLNTTLAQDTTKTLVCVYWNTTTNTWSTDGVTTGSKTGDSIECQTTHFTLYTVVANTKDTAVSTASFGWIAAVVIGALVIILLVVVLVVFLVKRHRRNKVVDIKRYNSRPKNSTKDERPDSANSKKSLIPKSPEHGRPVTVLSQTNETSTRQRIGSTNSQGQATADTRPQTAHNKDPQRTESRAGNRTESRIDSRPESGEDTRPESTFPPLPETPMDMRRDSAYFGYSPLPEYLRRQSTTVSTDNKISHRRESLTSKYPDLQETPMDTRPDSTSPNAPKTPAEKSRKTVDFDLHNQPSKPADREESQLEINQRPGSGGSKTGRI